MTFSKRSFLVASVAMALTPLATLARAQSMEAVPILDIVVMPEPASQTYPVRYSLSDGELGEFNALDDSGRKSYLANLMAQVVEAASEGKYKAANSAAALMQAMGDKWCGDCAALSAHPTLTISMDASGSGFVVTLQ